MSGTAGLPSIGGRQQLRADGGGRMLISHSSGRLIMSVFQSSPSTPPVLRAELPRLDQAQLAAAAFLARYGGRTLESYRTDLRQFFQCPISGSLHWRRLVLMSSSTGHRWRSEDLSPPPLTGGCRRCVAITGSRTSTDASRPIRRNTSAGLEFTRRHSAAWTVVSSPRFCTPLSGCLRCTPRSRCCSA